MKTSESKETSMLETYHGEIVKMLSEVEDWKKELVILNEGLIKSSGNTCSEYGDRLLQNIQSKLFYFQRVLKMSTYSLLEYKKELSNAMGGSVSKINQIREYQEYCHNSAEKISGKLSEYKQNTEEFISRNCGSD